MPTNKRQRMVLSFIKQYLSANHEAPTLREIGSYCGIGSLGYVHELLAKLEDAGLIKRTRKMRGIEVVEQEQKAA